MAALHPREEPRGEVPYRLLLAFVAGDETGTITLPADPVLEGLHALDLYERSTPCWMGSATRSRSRPSRPR